MADLGRAHFFLSGRVQGVGMRFHVHSLASKHGLVGFVRNLSDGRVEAVLEGSRKTIEKVVKELKEGGYADYVTDLSVEWEKADESFRSFEIW